MTATNIRPQRNGSAATGLDASQSPRDPRRVWATLLPRQLAYRNPAARALVEWADAVLSEEGWDAWWAAHQEGDPL